MSARPDRPAVGRDPKLDAPTIGEEHVRYVLRWLARFGVPEQDRSDVAQDALRIAVERLCTFAGGNFDGWLYRITQNVARNANRKRIKQRQRERSAGARDELDCSARIPSDAGQSVHTELDRFLDSLPPRDRTLFVLRELRGMAIDEVAGEVGMSRAQVYRRLRATRERLEALFSNSASDGSEPR